MGTADSPVAPGAITIDEFSKLLAEYPNLIDSIAPPKSGKHWQPLICTLVRHADVWLEGQKSLAELDQFRYEAAVELFGAPSSKREMAIEDVKSLVEWKLSVLNFSESLIIG